MRETYYIMICWRGLSVSVTSKMISRVYHHHKIISCNTHILYVLLLSLVVVGCTSPSSDAERNTAITENIDTGGISKSAECAPGKPVLLRNRLVSDGEAKQYFVIPFEVDAATQRIEIAYSWMDQAAAPNPNPLDSTTFDLGVWDQGGYGVETAFRGWSGSRQGRIDQSDPPVWIEAGSAERGYVPGAIVPGEWTVEIGAGAVKTGGSEFMVQINCLEQASDARFVADPAEKDIVITQNNPPYPGWMHADFHMHAFHSHGEGPLPADFVAQARSTGLDVLMYTEYIVPQHWAEIGQVQADNLDVLIYPGREIITYFGHINTFGETPNVIDYRQGVTGVDIGDIQQRSVDDGALIQINHPTTFEGPLFEDLCRGCAFELDANIDFSQVHSIEVQNAATETTSANLGIAGPPGAIENPFTSTAIDYWEDKLQKGFKITATSGSDAKGPEPIEPGRSGYGLSSTALCGNQAGTITRASVNAAIKSGCAFIKTYGTLHSPHIEMTTTNGSNTVTYGGSLAVTHPNTASMTLHITNGAGQSLVLIQNGNEIATPVNCDGVLGTSPVVLASDDVTCIATLTRAVSGDGPLGTFWRFDIKKRDPTTTISPAEIRTIIANPVFLVD